MLVERAQHLAFGAAVPTVLASSALILSMIELRSAMSRGLRFALAARQFGHEQRAFCRSASTVIFGSHVRHATVNSAKAFADAFAARCSGVSDRSAISARRCSRLISAFSVTSGDVTEIFGSGFGSAFGSGLRLLRRWCRQLLLAGAMLLDALTGLLADFVVCRAAACDTHAIVCTRQLEPLDLFEERLKVLDRRMQLLRVEQQQADCL